MTGSLGVSHDRSNGGSSVSIPVSDNGTYVSIIKIKNGNIDHSTLTFIDEESHNEIQNIINQYDKFVSGEMKKYVANHENKTIGIFNKGVKYEVEKVDIPELEGYVPDNQFIGMIEKREVKYNWTTATFGSRLQEGDICVKEECVEKPSKLDLFIYALMKEVRRDSLTDFIDNWEISKEEYEKIESWFKDKLDIKL